MLKPKTNVSEFEKYGFKKCKGEYGKHECYYLCVARGHKMLFVSKKVFCVFDWDEKDPRIHKNANCRYLDNRDYLDIVYDLIKANLLEKEWS